MKSIIHFSPLAALALLAVSPTAQAADNIATNGDFEKAAAAGEWPEGWGKPKAGGEWGKEGTNRFLSLKSTTPGEMVMLYQEFKIPAGTKKLEVSWKQRVTGLKRGAQPWFDVRIMLEWANADRVKISGKPKAPNVAKDTTGWEEKSITIDVPEYAAFLQFMPSLFQVEAGTFDLDDIVVKAVDAPAADGQ
ncbi:hypothetical protein OVA24_00780 [Luteolibacter sp. SL250]|uniref:hypothetical protein n=1 Tax=Luteolibacter sp. SL250 TaxID=2995170 RepID=UPI0022705F45|nr:hypothetical protein [Luteolibacter sp. SL250]WAC19911.1 hypothetical protein OVA24_00780 [Luteolibacter sp. SL250]